MLKLFGAIRRLGLSDGSTSGPDPARNARDVRVAWAIEVLSTGARHPVVADRFRIGGGPNDDLRMPGLDAAALTILFHANGEIWLGAADKSHEIAAEEPFDIGDLTLVVRTVFDGGQAPVRLVETYYPYMVTAGRTTDCAPYALIEDIASGARHRLAGGASAVLLHLLARKRLEDEAAGVDPIEAGWCDQRDVMVGIWGPAGDGAPLSRLNLLVCGIRQGLREAGFEPWFLEKRRGAIRIRALALRLDVALDEAADPDDQPTEPDFKVPAHLRDPQSFEDDRPTEPSRAK